MSYLHYRLLWQGVAYVLLAVILIASLLPVEHLPKNNDKVSHFLSYGILSAYWCLVFHALEFKKKINIALGLIVFGGIIELLQGASGYRYAEWADVWANSLGVIVAMLVLPKKAHHWLQSLDAFVFSKRQ